MRVLALDPSGNHGEKEGNGTTGWSLFENGIIHNFGHVEAKIHVSAEGYWTSVLELLDEHTPNLIVCESYKLFGHKAKQQSGSTLDTPQLIGALRVRCYNDNLPIVFQDPKDKTRVADPILVHMGILEERNGRYYALGRQTVIHSRDAIRHGVFYHRYTAKKSSS